MNKKFIISLVASLAFFGADSANALTCERVDFGSTECYEIHCEEGTHGLNGYKRTTERICNFYTHVTSFYCSQTYNWSWSLGFYNGSGGCSSDCWGSCGGGGY